MKSLDERLSEMVSPFEDNEQDQTELTMQQVLEYQKDSLIEAIGIKSGYQEFDLFLEDTLSQLDHGDTVLFLTDCISKLQTKYPIDVLADKIGVENIIATDPNSIVDLIKFFVYDKWMDSIVKYLPIFKIADLDNRETLNKIVKDSYLLTQEKIIKDISIQPLIRYHFDYCPLSDGVKTIMIFLFKDIPGVVSRQLVLNTGDEK